MIVSLIPFWIPLIWAIAVAIYWRFLWKDPINHYIVCLLVLAINFFFFTYSFIVFLLILIFKSGILNSLMNKNKKDGTSN